MEKKFELLAPQMPNFIRVLMPEKEGGDNERAAIPIESLTQEEAEQYGNLMKASFIEHWRIKSEK